jgi:hypothetical protein
MLLIFIIFFMIWENIMVDYPKPVCGFPPAAAQMIVLPAKRWIQTAAVVNHRCDSGAERCRSSAKYLFSLFIKIL